MIERHEERVLREHLAAAGIVEEWQVEFARHEFARRRLDFPGEYVAAAARFAVSEVQAAQTIVPEALEDEG